MIRNDQKCDQHPPENFSPGRFGIQIIGGIQNGVGQPFVQIGSEIIGNPVFPVVPIGHRLSIRFFHKVTDVIVACFADVFVPYVPGRFRTPERTGE